MQLFWLHDCRAAETGFPRLYSGISIHFNCFQLQRFATIFSAFDGVNQTHSIYTSPRVSHFATPLSVNQTHSMYTILSLYSCLLFSIAPVLCSVGCFPILNNKSLLSFWQRIIHQLQPLLEQVAATRIGIQFRPLS